MPIYPFECNKCGMNVELRWSIHDYDNLPVPKCCKKKMEQVMCLAFPKFTYTPGKWTGIYDLDYGKRSTWDLTVKGKYEDKIRRGECKNPFWDKEIAEGTRSAKTLKKGMQVPRGDILSGLKAERAGPDEQ